MRRGLQLAVGIAAAIVIANSSWLAPRSGPPRVLAHRGVHQTFDPEGIDANTCTAARIHPPTHSLIENTLPSMQAAFDAGAEVVELDVHATADGHLAVFHDHMLECRTDGTGAPEDHTLAELRILDLGHGYTTDDGATFPLRGAGRGLLVTLPEVYAAFPERRFLIHIKSGRPEDGDRVADVLDSLPSHARARQIVYGGAAADRVRERLPEVSGFTKGQLKQCLVRYIATGWTGHVPEACRDTWVIVPSNATWLVWGFPRRFEARMRSAGSEVALAGPYTGGASTGIDHPHQAAAVPSDWGGWVWTNRVEAISPLLPRE